MSLLSEPRVPVVIIAVGLQVLSPVAVLVVLDTPELFVSLLV